MECHEGLKVLLLDHNSVNQCPVATSLSNSALEAFSISFNPLTFDSVLALVESLGTNSLLLHLGVQGVPLVGPAPIKENSSGHLSKHEAVLLKLAYVLRHSSVRSVAVDLDVSARGAMEELADTLTKDNLTLVSLKNDSVDWKKSRDPNFIKIDRALRANVWIDQNKGLNEEEQQPASPDIEELLRLKQKSFSKHSYSPLQSQRESMDSLSHYSRQRPSTFSSLESFPARSSPEDRASIRLEELMESEYRGPTAQTPQFSSKPPLPFDATSEDEIIASTYDIAPKPSEESFKDSARSRDRSTDRSITVISAFNESLQHSEASDEEEEPPVPHKEVSFSQRHPQPSLNEAELSLMSSFFEGVSASMKRLEADVTSHLGALTERLSSLEDKVSAKSQDIDNLLDFACSLEEVVKKIEDKLAVKAT
jgi:hypothetical protein